MARLPRWLPPALVALPFVVGAMLLVASPGRRHSFGCTGVHLATAPLDHLGRCDHGARVEVSSSFVEGGHHPLFAIDGRVGGKYEKWMSFPGDPRPWIEIAWPRTVTVKRIILHHAGEREEEKFTSVDFDVDVWGPAGRQTVVRRRDNRSAVTSHLIPPVAIGRLRVTFLRPGQAAERAARLFEIEVLGG